jgi:hypothetical protein
MSEGRKHVGNMVVGDRAVASLTTGIKPVTSVWQILGIVVLAKLIFC